MRWGAEVWLVAAVGAVAAVAVRGDGWSPQFMLGAMGTLVLALGLWCWRRPPALSSVEKLLVLFVFWNLFLLMSLDRGLLGGKQAVGSWAVALLLWLACRRLPRQWAGAALMVMSTAATLLALTMVLDAWGMGAPRVGGAFGNPNIAAALLLPLALVVAGWLRGRAEAAPAWWVFPLFLTAASLLSGSRAVALGLMLAVLTGLPRGRLRLLGTALVLVVVVAVGSWRLATWPERPSWQRFQIWRAVSQLVSAHPLTGVGPAPLAEATGPYRLPGQGRVARHLHRIGAAESTFLGVAAHSGLPGLLLLGLALGLGGARARRAGWCEASHRRALLAVLLVYLVVHDQCEVFVVLWWWAALLGLDEAVLRPPGARPAVLERHAPLTCTSVLVAAFLAWCLVQPAWARTLWHALPSSPQTVAAAARAEPWFTEPVRWQLEALLSHEAWTPQQVAEAARLADELTRIDGGKASVWSLDAQVRLRIIEDFGPWAETVRQARRSLQRSCALEPLLPWDWLRWAQLERSLGALGRSAELAQRAVDAEPAFLRGWLFLARVELDRGRRQAARQALARAEAAYAQRFAATATTYEMALLEAPAWQLDQLRWELGASSSS